MVQHSLTRGSGSPAGAGGTAGFLGADEPRRPGFACVPPYQAGEARAARRRSDRGDRRSGLLDDLLLRPGDWRPHRGDAPRRADPRAHRRSGDAAGAAREARARARDSRVRDGASSAFPTTAAIARTPTSAGRSWCGTCSPRRSSRSSRGRAASRSPAASATAATTAGGTRRASATGLRKEGFDVFVYGVAGVLDARVVRRPGAQHLHPIPGRGARAARCSTSSRTTSST